MMSAQTATTTGVSRQDEEALRGLLRQLIDGWNQGSGEGFAAPFAEDGDQVAFDGTNFRGRQEIAAAHQQLFDRFLRGTRLVGKVTDIRMPTPDVAIMHAIGGTIMQGQTDLAPDRNSVQTLVAVKRDGRWQLAAFQNSRAEFMGRPEAAQALTAELRQLL
ncbi:MAG: SgcJ/EcaC family oxidoreductase [Thermomicrobiales bacterium]